MSGSNFTDEIKQSMQPKSLMKDKGAPPKQAGKRPPPKAAAPHDPGAVPKKPPPPHAMQNSGPPTPQPMMSQGPQGDVPGLHSAIPQAGPGGGGGLDRAHATVVHALMMRDRGM